MILPFISRFPLKNKFWILLDNILPIIVPLKYKFLQKISFFFKSKLPKIKIGSLLLFKFLHLQPVFGANYIKGKIRAQPNGNFTGETKFKMSFKSGGCIDFGQALLRAASMAQRNSHGMAPPPYEPPGKMMSKSFIYFLNFSNLTIIF